MQPSPTWRPSTLGRPAYMDAPEEIEVPPPDRWTRFRWTVRDFFEDTRTGKALAAIGAVLAILLLFAYWTALGALAIGAHAYVVWHLLFGWPIWTVYASVGLLAPIAAVAIIVWLPNQPEAYR